MRLVLQAPQLDFWLDLRVEREGERGREKGGREREREGIKEKNIDKFTCACAQWLYKLEGTTD